MSRQGRRGGERALTQLVDGLFLACEEKGQGSTCSERARLALPKWKWGSKQVQGREEGRLEQDHILNRTQQG